ncbi:MAG TPA: hypothetical protein VKW08_22275 [Xanthobacteraceae bacterium]|jgi:hypothetical protein|nr:hypothetical protein [Xanthobacteraceae bacterium]
MSRIIDTIIVGRRLPTAAILMSRAIRGVRETRPMQATAEAAAVVDPAQPQALAEVVVEVVAAKAAAGVAAVAAVAARADAESAPILKKASGRNLDYRQHRSSFIKRHTNGMETPWALEIATSGPNIFNGLATTNKRTLGSAAWTALRSAPISRVR